MVGNRSAFDPQGSPDLMIDQNIGNAYRHVKVVSRNMAFVEKLANSFEDGSLIPNIGEPGAAGKSAYQIWLDLGNTGTASDFLASLRVRGDDGKDAYDIWVELGNTGTRQQFINSLKSTVAGPKGADSDVAGPRGPAGRGIVSALLNSSSHLIITYTDGTTQDAGQVGTGEGGGGVITPPDPEPTLGKWLGVNAGGGVFYGGVRIHSNLANAHHIQTATAGNGMAQSAFLPLSYQNRTTNRVTIPTNECILFLMEPLDRSIPIVVRYTGTSTPRINRMNDQQGQPLAANVTTGVDGIYKTLKFNWVGNSEPLSLVLSAGYIDFFDAREENRSLNERYDPAYILDKSKEAMIRFMDLLNTNGNSDVPITEAFRPRQQDIFNLGDWGLPYEDCIDICKLAGTNGHFNWPYMADKTYVDGVITYAAANMADGTYFKAEWCNEPWNPQFVAYAKARDDWRASNAPTAPDDMNGPGDTYAGQVAATIKVHQWATAKALELGKTVGKNGWLRRTLNSQFGDGPNLAILLARPGLSAVNDYVDCANYLANNNEIWHPNYTVADIPHMLELLVTASDGVDAQIRRFTRMRTQVEAAGFLLGTYEAGTHLITNEVNPVVATAFHQDPLLEKIYSYYLREFHKRNPDTVYMVYSDFGPPSRYGSWGHRIKFGDTTSPRYLATSKAMNGVFNVPALTIYGTPPDGVANAAYSYQFQKYFGDGVDAPGTWDSPAGQLPPGMTLSASGLLSGTPTEGGEFTYSVRYRDQVSQGTVTKQFTTTFTAAINYTYLDDARGVGNLPATGGTSSRTNARGWNTDFGYAQNGAVHMSKYAWEYSAQTSFGLGINSKDREMIVDIDSTDWFDGGDVVIVPFHDIDTPANEIAMFLEQGGGGVLQIRKGGSYLANVGAFPELKRTKVAFRIEVIGGMMKVFANNNQLGNEEGYNIGTDYTANCGVIAYANTNTAMPIVLYNRIGLRSLAGDPGSGGETIPAWTENPDWHVTPAKMKGVADNQTIDLHEIVTNTMIPVASGSAQAKYVANAKGGKPGIKFEGNARYPIVRADFPAYYAGQDAQEYTRYIQFTAPALQEEYNLYCQINDGYTGIRLSQTSGGDAAVGLFNNDPAFPHCAVANGTDRVFTLAIVGSKVSIGSQYPNGGRQVVCLDGQPISCLGGPLQKPGDKNGGGLSWLGAFFNGIYGFNGTILDDVQYNGVHTFHQIWNNTKAANYSVGQEMITKGMALDGSSLFASSNADAAAFGIGGELMRQLALPFGSIGTYALPGADWATLMMKATEFDYLLEELGPQNAFLLVGEGYNDLVTYDAATAVTHFKQYLDAKLAAGWLPQNIVIDTITGASTDRPGNQRYQAYADGVRLIPGSAAKYNLIRVANINGNYSDNDELLGIGQTTLLADGVHGTGKKNWPTVVSAYPRRAALVFKAMVAAMNLG